VLRLEDLRDAIVTAVNYVIPCELRKTRSMVDKAPLVPPDRVSIFLLAEDEETLKPLHDSSARSPDAYPTGESVWVANLALKQNRPVFVVDTSQDMEDDTHLPGVLNWYKLAQQEQISTGHMIYSVIACLITDGEGKILGVLQAIYNLRYDGAPQISFREPDLANLCRLVPNIATKLMGLRGQECSSFIGDDGYGGLTTQQIIEASEGDLPDELLVH